MIKKNRFHSFTNIGKEIKCIILDFKQQAIHRVQFSVADPKDSCRDPETALSTFGS
jgi:hypothetical protein